jgi:hypothetical protein
MPPAIFLESVFDSHSFQELFRMTEKDMQVDILMKEYATVREEVLLHLKNAKLHLKHFQGYIAASFAIASYLFFSAEPGRVTAITNAIGMSETDLVFFVVFALNVASYYFALDILDSYFCMYLAAAQAANIESQINKITHRKLLIWESEFQSEAVAIWGTSRVLVTVYQLFLVGFVAVAIPLKCYSLLEAARQSQVAAQLQTAAQLLTPVHLIWPDWVGLARGFAVGAFVVFLLAFIDTFFIRPRWARRVIGDIVARKETTGHRR